MSHVSVRGEGSLDTRFSKGLAPQRGAVPQDPDPRSDSNTPIRERGHRFSAAC